MDLATMPAHKEAPLSGRGTEVEVEMVGSKMGGENI